MSSYNLTPPRRIVASNLLLPSHLRADEQSEPGVEVKVDALKADPLLEGTLMRAVVATSKRVPTDNDGHGELALDKVPGMGIVLPGGLNMYYLDLAPNTEGTCIALHKPYNVNGGEDLHAKAVETVCQAGDIVVQRGMMHALSNRTGEWVRLLAVVLSSNPNKVPVEGTESHKELPDVWLP